MSTTKLPSRTAAIMVTLTAEPEEIQPRTSIMSENEDRRDECATTDDPPTTPTTPKMRSSEEKDPALLSPPAWRSPRSKSRSRSRTAHGTRHRSTRSQSAPPGPTPSSLPSDSHSSNRDSNTRRNPFEPPGPISAPVNSDGFDSYRTAYEPMHLPNFSTFSLNGNGKMKPRRAYTLGAGGIGVGVTTWGGELVRPAPPLLRPTTFWRHTRRSGVSSPSYSPSSHVVRRSTYIAAGLRFDFPNHDLMSALCVESRLTSGAGGVVGGVSGTMSWEEGAAGRVVVVPPAVPVELL